MNKSFIILSAVFCFLSFTASSVHAQLYNFRSYDPLVDQPNERHCKIVSLSENLGVTISGSTGPGCTFTADVIFNGDWVYTGDYFDSPPYAWGNVIHYYDPGSSSSWKSFTCANPTYNLDTSWLPADVQLVSSSNISSSDDSIAPSKRFTLKVASNATPGDTFDLDLDASANCTMYVRNKDKNQDIKMETVQNANTSASCVSLPKININPRKPQRTYTVTIGNSSCASGTATPTPKATNTPTPKPTKTPTPTPPPGSTPTPTGGLPTPTDTPDPTDTPVPSASPTPFHLACSSISCTAIAGAGSNSCSPRGAKCSQTVSGGTCSATCGTGTVTQSCSCAGPCCPGYNGTSGSGTCKNGMACGTSGTITCCVDQPPQKPTNLKVTQPDGGTIIHTRFVKLSWNFVLGASTGCGTPWGYSCSGNSQNFYIQIDDNDDFSSPIVDLPNIPANTTSYTTTLADGALTANTTYYAQVCAVNNTASCIQVTFVKQPYPVGLVFGNVGEFSGNSSVPFTNNGASDGSMNFTINPPVVPGINTTCSKTTGTNPSTTKTYSCTITFDNVNSDPNPTQLFTFTSSNFDSNLYSNDCFKTGATSCDSNTTIPMNFDNNSPLTNNINKDVFFALNTDLTFLKLKNASIQTHNLSGWSSYFPVSTSIFNGSDSDDYNSGGNYLIIGNAPGSFAGVGLTLFNSDVSLGAGLPSEKAYPNPPGKNWYSKSYSPVTVFNSQRFLDYVKTRKEYQSITSLNQLKPGVINVWTGSPTLTIDNGGAGKFNGQNTILIVPGTVYFSINGANPSFTPTGETAIIADTIYFSDASGSNFLTEADGIFIGNTVHLGTVPSNQPLKIVGNLASLQFPITLDRVRDDNRMPSLFVVFNVDPYVDMLPQLSTATYEWKQLQ